jgi:hypothetical protein
MSGAVGQEHQLFSREQVKPLPKPFGKTWQLMVFFLRRFERLARSLQRAEQGPPRNVAGRGELLAAVTRNFPRGDPASGAHRVQLVPFLEFLRSRYRAQATAVLSAPNRAGSTPMISGPCARFAMCAFKGMRYEAVPRRSGGRRPPAVNG